MEDLLREILAPSPALQATSLPAGPVPPPTSALSQHTQQAAPPSEAAPSPASSLSVGAGDWQGEADMQKLLGLLSSVQPGEHADEFPSALDLELCGWDEMGGAGAFGASTEVGVF